MAKYKALMGSAVKGLMLAEQTKRRKRRRRRKKKKKKKKKKVYTASVRLHC